MKIEVLKLYYLLFILITFGVIISFSTLKGARIYLYDLPILLISPISVFYLWDLRKKIAKIKYLLLFLLVGLMGLFFYLSEISELLSSLAYLIRLVLYLLLSVPIFFFSKNDIKKLIKVIMGSGIAFSIIGYFQYIFYKDLANLYYLGWDRHLYRLFSTFLDPNFSGIYLVLLFVLSLSFLLTLNSKRKNRWLFFITILYLPAIFLTYSRTAYITLVVTICTYLLFVNKKLVFVFALLFLVVILFIPKNFGGEGVNLLRTSSIFARLEASEVAYSIFVKNPIIGVGFNAFKYAQLQEGTLLPSQINSHAASGVSNSYLFILATTGILGFFLLGAFILQILNSQLKFLKRNMLTPAVFAGIIGVLAASLFENALFYSPILIFLIILTAITLRLEKLSDK